MDFTTYEKPRFSNRDRRSPGADRPFCHEQVVIRLSTLIGILWPLSIIGIGFIIFMENRSPQSTLAWFLILAFLPAVGVLLYLLFGRSRWRRKKHLHRAEEQRKLFREILAGRRLNLARCLC